MLRERDTHHLFWERHDYHQRPLNLLRGLVVARNVLIQPHRDLHAELDSPPRPHAPLAHNIINHLSNQVFHHPLDPAFETVEYLFQVASPEALELGDHLSRQLNYLVGSYES